jgi:microcystin-dependent protein
MSCSNCFNGCVQITSDQCIKYTGPTIASLGIENGVSLAATEEAITDYLITVLAGTGIVPTIDANIICTLISDFLPEGDATLNDILTAIIQAACALDTRITNIESDTSTLNSAYDTDCFTVTDETDTHEVLQAVIDALCTLNISFTSLLSSLPATYVQLADLDSLIASYIGGTSSGLMNNKMVPYTAMEYYGPLTYFDATGAGTGDWVNIYLCNGQNGTPDKRGRVAVGVTDGSMLGGAFQAAVDPALGNPNYSLYSIEGANSVALTNVLQIPSHTHIATPIVTVADHTHLMVGNGGNKTTLTSAYPIKIDELSSADKDYRLAGTDLAGGANVGRTSADKSTTTVTVTNSSAGGTMAHNNIQPSIGTYFIIYLP